MRDSKGVRTTGDTPCRESDILHWLTHRLILSLPSSPPLTLTPHGKTPFGLICSSILRTAAVPRNPAVKSRETTREEYLIMGQNMTWALFIFCFAAADCCCRRPVSDCLQFIYLKLGLGRQIQSIQRQNNNKKAGCFLKGGGGGGGGENDCL